MSKLMHDPVCPNSGDEDGCHCATWLRQGESAFDPESDCDRCGCFCDIIAEARADEREKWLDFSGQRWGTHAQSCEWWGRDHAYMAYCEDTYAAGWVACPCEKT